MNKKKYELIPSPRWKFTATLFYLLLLLSFICCTKFINYENSNNQHILKEIGFKIDSYQVIPVLIGISSTNLSKGFWVYLSFNPLAKEDILELSQGKAIDSWIVMVKRKDKDRNEQIVGLITIPLFTTSSIDGKKSARIVDKFKFYVYYDAIAYRKSQEKCPPGNHKKSIMESELLPRDFGRDSKYGVLSLAEQQQLGEQTVIADFNSFSSSDRITPADYELTSIAAGDSLTGDYEISMTLYNSSLRVVKANWIEAKDKIRIGPEQEITLPGCP